MWFMTSHERFPPSLDLRLQGEAEGLVPAPAAQLHAVQPQKKWSIFMFINHALK